MHPLVEPFSFLIGNWIGKDGVGIYPTIEKFLYDETLEITSPAAHQPCLHFKYVI